jgi:hypothetical protein
MFGIEAQLLEKLLLLRDTFKVSGIKAEFEAEGLSFRDLVRLRRVTVRRQIDVDQVSP